MFPVGYQEGLILLILALMVVGAFRLPELVRGQAEAVSEISRSGREDDLCREVTVLALLFCLTAVCRAVAIVLCLVPLIVLVSTGVWR